MQHPLLQMASRPAFIILMISCQTRECPEFSSQLEEGKATCLFVYDVVFST